MQINKCKQAKTKKIQNKNSNQKTKMQINTHKQSKTKIVTIIIITIYANNTVSY